MFNRANIFEYQENVSLCKSDDDLLLYLTLEYSPRGTESFNRDDMFLRNVTNHKFFLFEFIFDKMYFKSALFLFNLDGFGFNTSLMSMSHFEELIESDKVHQDFYTNVLDSLDLSDMTNFTHPVFILFTLKHTFTDDKLFYLWSLILKDVLKYKDSNCFWWPKFLIEWEYYFVSFYFNNRNNTKNLKIFYDYSELFGLNSKSLFFDFLIFILNNEDKIDVEGFDWYPLYENGFEEAASVAFKYGYSDGVTFFDYKELITNRPELFA